MNRFSMIYVSVSKLIWSMAAVLLLGAMASPPVEGHAIEISLSAFGTAAIDGILSPGEWDQAAQFGFFANRPATEGGGSIRATVCEMNDGVNLYLAAKITRPSFGGDTTVAFSFDNHHAGVHQNEDEPTGGGISDDFW